MPIICALPNRAHWAAKSATNWTVPLCIIHHRALHDFGAEEKWWEQIGIDALGEAEKLCTVGLALAERAVLCAWRLRRVYRIETGLFRKARKDWGNGTAAQTNEIAVVFLRLASQEDDLSKLTRYEISLERSLQRALRALDRRQASRGGGAVPGLVLELEAL